MTNDNYYCLLEVRDGSSEPARSLPGGLRQAWDGLNPLDGATLWDHLVDCPFHHFQYDVRTGQNFFPKNVYPEDLPQLGGQVRPLRTFPVEVRDGEDWVDLG